MNTPSSPSTDSDGVDGLAVSHDGPVLRLRLDRPHKRNALTDDIVAGLIAHIEAATLDEQVRVIELSATGDHFCSGFDVLARNAGGAGERPRAGSIARRLPLQAHRLIPTMVASQTPIVTAARGWVAGIGLHLVLASDFAVVATDARMWEPFSARGFTPDSGGTWLLPRLVGVARAKDMLLLGREVSGSEAEAWGMVHRCVPADRLDTATAEVVDALAGAATVTLGLTKWLVHTGLGLDLDRHLANEAFAMEVSSRSQDFREGIAALRERRPTEFTGR